MDVLLVEDDMITRKLLIKIISAQGHTVYDFASAEEAWHAFQEKHYSLLVLDWMLPGMTGLDMCRKVRQSPRGDYCVILVITAMSKPFHLEEVLEAGADDYLAKPLKRELLNVRLTIAERKARHLQQHQAAQEQLRLLGTAMKSTSEGVLITTTKLDHRGPRVVFANRFMADMTGYDIDELVGSSLNIFQGLKTSKDYLCGMSKVLQGESSYSIETFFYRKDNSSFLVKCNIAPVRDETGKITHFVCVHRDITETRRLQRELVKVSEREQQRIGRDLHDGLGQKLTGLTFMVKSLERRLRGSDEESAKQALTIANLVNEAKSDAKTLSRDLVRFDLKGSGLILALEELAARVEQFSGITCKVYDGVTIPILDETVAMHIYRICQEALNNAVKHSGATQVDIELKQVGDHLNISIEDNGKGLPEYRDEGLGLSIMAYRAQVINATLNYTSGDRGGLRVWCSMVNPGFLAQN